VALPPGKPLFVYCNPARMHVTTMLPDKYLDMIGVKGGKGASRWACITEGHE